MLTIIYVETHKDAYYIICQAQIWSISLNIVHLFGSDSLKEKDFPLHRKAGFLVLQTMVFILFTR